MNDPWPTSESVYDDGGAIARRAGQLEHTLRTLEALDAFRVEASALRAEIQQLRAFEQQPRAARRAWPRASLPNGLGRLLTEVAILLTVAVTVGLLDVSSLGILAAMGATWFVLALFEVIASGALVRPLPVYPPARQQAAATPPTLPPAAERSIEAPPEELELVAPAAVAPKPVSESVFEVASEALSETVPETVQESAPETVPGTQPEPEDAAANGTRTRRLSLPRRLRRRREESPA